MNLPFRRLLLTFAALPALLIEAEDNDPTFGHSVHGEVFNEGPRQAAVLISGTGNVHFEVTTNSEDAQAFFNQGIGQLHGFWDFEAERSFRQVASIDPDCAMAYWGMAMANYKNNERGLGFIEEAVNRKDMTSDREQRWIDGLAAYFENPKADLKKRLRDYVRSLEDLAFDYPDDIEAQAFLLRQIYYNNGKGLAIPSHYAINLLADQILTTSPDHPANHYQIHLWDREDAERALAAAANCGPAAPGIAHMWHMPSHIYSKLKRYEDAAWHQEASARVDHEHMIRFQIVPDQIHNFAHNNEWYIRNMNTLGQLDRSVKLATNMISLPRVAKFKNDQKKETEVTSTYEPRGSSWQFGRQRLRDTLVRFEQWDTLVEESEGGVLTADDVSIRQRDFDRYVGIAKFEIGDRQGAAKHLAALNSVLAEKTNRRNDAVKKAATKATAAKKNEKEIKAATDAAAKPFKSDIDTFQNFVNELNVYKALTAIPPQLDLAKELLPKLKNLAKWRHASLWHRAGDDKQALKLAKEAVTAAENEVLPLAMKVRALHASGNTEEARTAFEDLRHLASVADIDIPALAALAPVAKSFGYPEDWRLTNPPADDLGERPDLDKLGPFQWSPPAAHPFSLPDAKDETVSLADYSGRPVLVIFFLGRGCTHCMEQLNAFAPMTEDYRKAGIEIVAISTDSIDGLNQTFQDFDEQQNPFPFTLLSDQSLDRFKAYRAYDDFEAMALHGTYLIDGEQQIRWQEISFEPFMHPEWLLEECERLLAIGES
ncbi:MAG: alkyl hydroperoxide reductase [Verrucomicrobiales bacterium]|nr:alkyl hydroperoxide reductase [Verrucomicrobiales bacterium]